MARVIVVNPPHRRKHKKRHFTAAMRRAAMRNLHKARAKLNPRKRHHRRAKHHRRRHSHFVNPYAGTLAVLGNPGHHRGHRKRRHTMARHHKRHHRRHHSNPFSANALMATPKEMISTENLMAAAGVTAGFILPGMAMNYLPVTWRQTTVTYYVSKVATVAVISAVGSMVSKRVAKFVLLGGTVSILLDLYAEWMSGKSPAAAPAPAVAPGTQAFYGNLAGVKAYYGGMVNDFEVY